MDCSSSPQAALHVYRAGICHCDLRFAVGVEVPAAALLFRPKPQVAILDKNVVEFRDVKIGVGDGDIIQIESGLKEGDRVVLKSNRFWNEG